MQKNVKKVIAGGAVILVLAGGFLLFQDQMNANQTRQRLPEISITWENKLTGFSQRLSDIRDEVQKRAAVVQELPEETYQAPPELISLMAENEHAIGWLKVSGTNIDYPLMQHEDNEYFLHRDINGNDSYPGSVYMDSNHDIGLKGLHILYGHNMKNGTMFRDVVKFMDREYFNNHQDVKIYAADKEFVLEPIYCYAARADGYYRSKIEKQDELEAFLLEKTGQELSADNIFVLITCSYGSEDERTYLICREVMKDNNNPEDQTTDDNETKGDKRL